MATSLHAPWVVATQIDRVLDRRRGGGSEAWEDLYDAVRRILPGLTEGELDAGKEFHLDKLSGHTRLGRTWKQLVFYRDGELYLWEVTDDPDLISRNLTWHIRYLETRTGTAENLADGLAFFAKTAIDVKRARKAQKALKVTRKRLAKNA